MADSILQIDPHEQTARIEPGVVLDQLNVAAALHRLQFAPDVATSSRANIGGMIGSGLGTAAKSGLLQSVFDLF